MLKEIPDIKDGDIIRFHNDNIRDWVAIHYTHLHDDTSFYEKYRKNIKNHTGYYLFGSLNTNYSDVLNPDSYNKYKGQLEIGHFNNICIVGNITNIKNQKEYNDKERITCKHLFNGDCNKKIHYINPKHFYFEPCFYGRDNN